MNHGKWFASLILVQSLWASAAPEPAFKASSVANGTIAIAREGANVSLTFAGTLESAQTPSGPWAEVPDAHSPFAHPATGAERYFRIREQTSGSVFSSQSILELTVSGPMQQHFELAFAGLPDGIFPPVREKPYFTGKVEIEGLEIPVSLRVRGNSSLQECPFPKLKLKVSKEDRTGTPFFDAREVKIGTHCAEGGRGTVGRLRDERAAYREALAYEVLELLGFVSPRIRRARIEYHDTSVGSDGTVGWELSRNAVLLDDIEVVAERLGGRALDDEEVEALTKANFSEQMITDMQLFHALLGNWDYALSTNGENLWNTDVIELSDKKLLPVAGDFDLSSWVTSEVRLGAPPDFHPELADVERQARFEVEQIQKRVSADSFNQGKARFLNHRLPIEMQVASAQLDDEGRGNALRHIAAFYEALAAMTKP